LRLPVCTIIIYIIFRLLHVSASYVYLLCITLPPPPISTLFPYTTLFRSGQQLGGQGLVGDLFVVAPGDEDDLLVKAAQPRDGAGDRKSTRLNSSHVSISYAVFCLKKKKKHTRITGCDAVILIHI